MTSFVFLAVLTISLPDSSPAKIECVGSLSSLSNPSKLEQRFSDYFENFKVQGRTLYLKLGRSLEHPHDRDVLAKVAARLIVDEARRRGYQGPPDELLQSPHLKETYLPSTKAIAEDLLIATRAVTRLTKILRREVAPEAPRAEKYREYLERGLESLVALVLERIQKHSFHEIEEAFLARINFSNTNLGLPGRIPLAGVRLAARDLQIPPAQFAAFAVREQQRSFKPSTQYSTESQVFDDMAKRAREIIMSQVFELGAHLKPVGLNQAQESLLRTSLVRLGWSRREDLDRALGTLEALASALTSVATDAPFDALDMKVGFYQRLLYLPYDGPHRGVVYPEPDQGLTPQEIVERALEYFSPIQKLQDDYRQNPFWAFRKGLAPGEIVLLDQVVPQLLRRLYGRQKESLKSRNEPNVESAVLKAAAEDAEKIKEVVRRAVTREWIIYGVQKGLERQKQISRILDTAMAPIIERGRFGARLDEPPVDESIGYPSKDSELPKPDANSTPMIAPLPMPTVAEEPQKTRPATKVRARIDPIERALENLLSGISSEVEPDRDHVRERALSFIKSLDRDEKFFLRALESPKFDSATLTGSALQIYRRWLGDFGIDERAPRSAE